MDPRRLRSLTVSLATAALDAGLFALCYLALAGVRWLLLARWVCGALGAVANFLGNRLWAFGRAALESREPWTRQAARYAATALLAVSLATALFWALLRLTGWDPRLLHPVSLGLTWLGFTFPLLRRWVFRPAARRPAPG